MKIRKIKRPKIRIRRPRVRIRWRKRASKWVIGTVVLFFAALFAFQLVLMNYSRSILQNILNLQLELVTGGIYASSFDDIEINYTNRSLTITNLYLVPKEETGKAENAVGDREQYHIFVPEVKISDINLRKAYFDNYLEIGKLLLLQPEIKIFADFDDPEKKSPGILKDDLYKLLPSNIDEFRVRTVRIKDGEVNLHALKNGNKNNIYISPLQFELNNFHLSEENAAQADKIFYTDSFFLEADTITGDLSGHSYGLDIKSLKISSLDSSAFARDIRLYPLIDAPVNEMADSVVNIYHIDFPQVYIYGLSYNDLYHTQDLIAEEVTILNPDFQLTNYKPLNPGQKESFKLENLYPVIDKVLTSIQIENLNLRNGEIAIFEHREQLQEKLISAIQEVNIKNFILDSASVHNDEKLLYSDQINFKLHNYSLRLSDNLHLLQADELVFSSDNSEIKATAFKVLPDPSRQKLKGSRNSYFASVPSIHLQGVDMLNAYNNNILNIDSLRLRQPTFTLLRNGKKDAPSSTTTGKEFGEEDLYALIEDYLYELSIDKISLKKGTININNRKNINEGTFISHIREASLWKFRLDSASAYQMNKLFYANDFELEIENYEHELPDDLHRITADEIGISTLKDRIYISDIQIFADENQYPFANIENTEAKSLINLHIPYLELEEVDILKAYLHKSLEVGRVSIPFPSIQLGSLLGQQSDRKNLIKSSAIYDLIKDYLEVVQVNNLRLQSGQLDLAFYADKDPLLISGRNTDILVRNFRFDSLTSLNPKRLFFADNVKVQMEDFSTHLPDGVHIISAERLFASTEQQEILVEEVKIGTAQTSYSKEELLRKYGQKGYFNLHLPKARLNGINFDNAYYQEYLQIDSVVAEQPSLRYTYFPKDPERKSEKKPKLREKTFYEVLKPYFAALEINNLVLKDGNFSALKQEDGKDMESTRLEGISLRMAHYLVDSSAVHDKNRFLFADDIRINISQYRQELLDKVHTISAQNLSLSTALKYVKAENINLKPDSKNLQQFDKLVALAFRSRYNIHLPKLFINGIGFDEVYRNGNLVINELILQKPDINVKHHVLLTGEDKSKERKGLGNPGLEDLIKGNLKSLKVKTARILNAQGNYIRITGQAAPLRLKADHFDAHIYNFRIGEKFSTRERLMNADDVNIFLTGFERKLPDSLHLLKLEELSISTVRNEIEVNGAELVPRWETDLLQKLKDRGGNRLFHVRLPKSKISSIDPLLLQKDSLVLQSILLSEGALDIYRFSGLSGNSAQEKPADKNWTKELLKSFQLIQSDSLALKDGKITFITVNEEQDSTSLQFNSIRGLVTGFKLDSILALRSDRILFSDRLQLGMKNYATTIDNGLYRLKIDDLLLDTWKQNVVIDSISVVPLVDRNTFAQTKGYETDMFTLKNRKLTIVKPDYQALFKGDFLADSLLLDGFALHVYRDKRQPYPQDHYPKMPQDIIRNLDNKLFIKGIAIKNGYIGYEEQVKGAIGTGFIDLKDLSVLSDTITNDSSLLAQGLTTNIKMECMLMGRGKLKAFFEIPLNDSLNSHKFYGSLEEMQLSAFNPILEKTIFMKIKDGHTRQIKFYVEANRNIARGVMDFEYQELKVAFVNKKTGNTEGPLKEIGSLLANWLVVNTNNLDDGNKKPFKQGEMVYERDEHRSIINYWVKTLVNGFKSSIGL